MSDDGIWKGFQIEKILAYLAKQKENIEKEYVFRPLAGTNITTAANQAVRRVNEGDRLVLAFNGAYIPVRKGCNANKIVEMYDAFIEQQKDSASNSFDDVWDEEDCEEIIAEGQKLTPRFKELLKEVCHAWYDRGAKLEKQKECDEANFREGYLHGFEDAQKEQKPSEWSEEDIHIINILECIVGKHRPDEIFKIGNKQGVSAYKICSWLKSLHERFNLQPKNGWSEEDKETIDLTIAVLKENLPNGYFKTNPANTLNMGAIHTDELITRLKSLRPQPKKELSIEKAIKWLDDTFYFLDNSSGRGRDCEITTHDFDSLEEMYDSFRKAVIVDSESHWKPSEEQKPEAKLTGWVARDEDEKIWVYETCPKKYSEWQQWVGNYGSMRLDEKSFPDIKWETGPVEVEITIKKK